MVVLKARQIAPGGTLTQARAHLLQSGEFGYVVDAGVRVFVIGDGTRTVGQLIDAGESFDSRGGKQVQSGEGAPSNSLGRDGEIYFDVEGLNLWGPKVSGSWAGTGPTPIGGGGGVTDHGALTGLSDDDHPLYLTTGRADTWLSAKTSDALPQGATNLYLTPAERSKLAGVESGATADMNAAEILAAVISLGSPATNLDADLLDGYHAAAFARKAENASISGAWTFATINGRNPTTDGAKLDGIEAGATADQTGAEILALLLPVDGAGTSLDADLLDGQHGAYYQNAGNLNAGSIPSARVPAAAVTQHQAALAIATTQLTGQINASQLQSGWVLTAPGSYPVTPSIRPRRTARGWTGHVSAASFRPAAGVAYYVDIIEGDDANAGTSTAAPLKSIEIALEKADVGTVWVAPGIYRWGNTWATPTFAIGATAGYSVRRWPVRTGEVFVTSAQDAPTWTADGTYPHVHYTTSTFAERIVDVDVPLANGGYYAYAEATTLAKCAAQPGSWYWDSGATRAYINPLRRGVPSDSTLVIRGFNAAVDSGARRTIFIDGLTFISGGNGFLALNNSGTSGGTVIARRCKFVDCFAAGFTVQGYATSIVEDCLAAENVADGFVYNVQGAQRTTNAVEVRRRSVGNGTTQYTNTANGSSIHDGMAITRIACWDSDNVGPQCADVNAGTFAWLVGCYAGQSSSVADTAQASGFQFLGGATAWLYDCESTTNVQDLAVGASSTVYRDQCNFATEVSGGTLSTYVQT